MFKHIAFPLTVIPMAFHVQRTRGIVAVGAEGAGRTPVMPKRQKGQVFPTGGGGVDMAEVQGGHLSWRRDGQEEEEQVSEGMLGIRG